MKNVRRENLFIIAAVCMYIDVYGCSFYHSFPRRHMHLYCHMEWIEVRP